MSKHGKHKHHGHKHNETDKASKNTQGPASDASAPKSDADTKLASLESEDTKPDGEAEDSQAGVFQNLAELNGRKSGGHEPIHFIPPNPPMDLSAQAGLDGHAAAQEDKDPAEVQQELSHKEILAGALDPTSPNFITKDLPDDGKNPDAAVAEDAPADEKKDKPEGDAAAGQETNGSPEAPVALTQPSTDGSTLVDAEDPNAPHTDASGVDLNIPAGSPSAGATPSAS